MAKRGLEHQLDGLFSSSEPEPSTETRPEPIGEEPKPEVIPASKTVVVPGAASVDGTLRKAVGTADSIPQSSRRQRTNRPFFWLALVAVAIALLVRGGLWLQGKRDSNNSAPFETAKVFIGTLSLKASAMGQVLPQREATLSSAAVGRIGRVYVEVGDEVGAGDALVRVESEALQRAVQVREQDLAIQKAALAELTKGTREEDLAAAKAAVASARAQVDDLLAGPSDIELADANAQLSSAQAQLDDLLAGPSDKELARAKAALVGAQAIEGAEAARYAGIDDQITAARLRLDLEAVDLESARYFYDALKNDWQHKDYADFSPEAERLENAQIAYNAALASYHLTVAGLDDRALRDARAQVAQARADMAALTEVPGAQISLAKEKLALAQANLAALTRPRTALLATAHAQLAQAEAKLAHLLAGPSPEALSAAEARVRQAQIALSDAQEQLSTAVLTAPFDGVVTAVKLGVGEWAEGPVIELVDMQSLQVVLDVDEVDVGRLAVGQEATLVLEAWPQHVLSGRVVAIPPKADAQSQVIVYQVHISLDRGDLPVRVGMTASANLITNRREKVLLVSNLAIVADREAGVYYAYRVKGEAVEKVEIAVGSRDDVYTEVVAGLKEGDVLAIGYDAGGPLSKMEGLWGLGQSSEQP